VEAKIYKCREFRPHFKASYVGCIRKKPLVSILNRTQTNFRSICIQSFLCTSTAWELNKFAPARKDRKVTLFALGNRSCALPTASSTDIPRCAISVASMQNDQRLYHANLTLLKQAFTPKCADVCIALS